MHNALEKQPHGGVLCEGCYYNTLTGIKADNISGCVLN